MWGCTNSLIVFFCCKTNYYTTHKIPGVCFPALSSFIQQIVTVYLLVLDLERYKDEQAMAPTLGVCQPVEAGM